MTMVLLASWLFAVSTMISWSYYGEQAMVYLFGKRLLSGQYRAFSPIPYGPYIIIATIIVMFFRDPVAAAIFGW